MSLRVAVGAIAGTLPARSSCPGTLIAAITFGLATGSGDIVNVRPQAAWGFAPWLRSLHGDGDIAFQQLEQFIHDIVLNGQLQVLEHTKGFVLELDQGIALPNRTEMNAGPHHVQRIDVVLPQAINDL